MSWISSRATNPRVEGTRDGTDLLLAQIVTMEIADHQTVSLAVQDDHMAPAWDEILVVDVAENVFANKNSAATGRLVGTRRHTALVGRGGAKDVEGAAIEMSLLQSNNIAKSQKMVQQRTTLRTTSI